MVERWSCRDVCSLVLLVVASNGCVAEPSAGGDDASSESSGADGESSGIDDGASSATVDGSSSGDGGSPIAVSCGEPTWFTVDEPGEFVGVSIGAADTIVAWGTRESEARWVRYGIDGTELAAMAYSAPIHAVMLGGGVDGSDRVRVLVDEFVEFIRPPEGESEGFYRRHKWLGAYDGDTNEQWVVDFGIEPDVEFHPWNMVVAVDGTAIVAGSTSAPGTHLRAFDPTGAVLWDVDWPTDLMVHAVDDGGVVVATEGASRVVGIRSDGSEAWGVPLDLFNAFDAVAVGDSVYVAGQTAHSLYAARIGTDGVVAWEDTAPVHDGYDMATGIAVGPQGHVAVVGSLQGDDGFPAWLRILDADGTILRTDECAVDDGEGSTDTRINDVAFDGAGNLFAVGSADLDYGDDAYHSFVGAWTIP